MGERTTYTPGTFCWTDLATTDQEGAKAFYGALFGWEATDSPIGEGVVYSSMSMGGKDVAGIAPQPEQQRQAGIPPAWNSYVSVESADAATEKAKQAGASVHAEAFDVFTLGRMAVVQDPQGAFFMVWEPKDSPGAALVNAPGALCWNELASPDMDASGRFYGELFGWTTEPIEGMEMPYETIKTAAGGTNGGIRQKMEEEPPYWLVYFGTEDVEAGVARVTELGGRQVFGPIDIGAGKIAAVQDPQGAVFALYAGQFEP
jgi:predicted enzyme related to lactoylglutathione lyase